MPKPLTDRPPVGAVPAPAPDASASAASRWRRRLERFAALALAAAALWALGELLWSCYCAFFSGKFFYGDYARYTQMIRNCTFGRPFYYTPTDSYLAIHLSFTLGLLGPLFRIWDHAFLLSFVQWLALAGGTVVLAACLRRRGVPPVAAAAILLFWTAYPATQGLMLDEFHTVGLYYLLVPWLYWQILVCRTWAWLPVALILGIREDAAFFLLPPLLYFARRERWRGGYVLAATSAVYSVLAIFVLYPAINGGGSLFDMRAAYLDATRPDTAAWTRRAMGVGVTLLPLLAGAPVRRLWPVALILLGGLVPAMLSGHPRQQMLRTIYAGPVMVWIPVVLAEAWTAWRRAAERQPAAPAAGRAQWLPLAHAALLAAAVATFHYYSGFIRFGRHNRLPCYRHPSTLYRYAAALERAIPKDRVLLTDKLLAALGAARAGVFDWDHFDPRRFHFDAVLTTVPKLRQRLDGALLEAVRRGTLGVVHDDGLFVVLCRHTPADRNAGFLRALDGVRTLVAATHRRAGTDIPTAGTFVRHWPGGAGAAAALVSHGAYRLLPAGRHTVRLHYEARRPDAGGKGGWGRFALHHHGRNQAPLAEAPLPPRPSLPGEAPLQFELTVDLPEETPVEFRVTGQDAPLWMHHVEWPEPPRARE